MKSRIAVFVVTGLTFAVTWGLARQVLAAGEESLPDDAALLEGAEPPPTLVFQDETPRPSSKPKPVDFELTLPELRLPPYRDRPYTDQDKSAAALLDGIDKLSDEEKLKTGLSFLERYADTQPAYRARKAVFEMLRKLRGEVAANAFADQEESKGHWAGRDVPGDLLRTAEASLEANPAESERIFNQIVKEHGKSYAAFRAYPQLAKLCQKRGDTRAEVDWLKRAIEFEWKNECLLRETTRSDAIARLAAINEEAGKWENALALWKNVDCRGAICGNHYIAVENSKAERSMYCLCQLRRYDEAIKLAWPAGISGEIGGASCISWMLYKLYRDAGQLNDLAAMIDAHDSRTKEELKALELHEQQLIEAFGEQLVPYSLRKTIATGEMPNVLVRHTLLAGARDDYFRKQMAINEALSTPDGRRAQQKLAEAKYPFNFPPPSKGSLPKSISLPATKK